MSNIVSIVDRLKDKANREGWYAEYEPLRVMDWFYSIALDLKPFLQAALHGDNEEMKESGYEAGVVSHDGACVKRVDCIHYFDEVDLKDISAGVYELKLVVTPDGHRTTTYRKKLLGES